MSFASFGRSMLGIRNPNQAASLLPAFLGSNGNNTNNNSEFSQTNRQYQDALRNVIGSYTPMQAETIADLDPSLYGTTKWTGDQFGTDGNASISNDAMTQALQNIQNNINNGGFSTQANNRYSQDMQEAGRRTGANRMGAMTRLSPYDTGALRSALSGGSGDEYNAMANAGLNRLTAQNQAYVGQNQLAGQMGQNLANTNLGYSNALNDFNFKNLGQKQYVQDQNTQRHQQNIGATNDANMTNYQTRLGGVNAQYQPAMNYYSGQQDFGLQQQGQNMQGLSNYGNFTNSRNQNRNQSRQAQQDNTRQWVSMGGNAVGGAMAGA